MGGRDPLYPRSKRKRVATRVEALSHSQHGYGALPDTRQPFTNKDRAPSLQGGSSAEPGPFDYSDPTGEPQTTFTAAISISNYSCGGTEPIRWPESETSWLNQPLEDGECTPRECPDDDEPSDDRLMVYSTGTEAFDAGEINLIDVNAEIGYDVSNQQAQWDDFLGVDLSTTDFPDFSTLSNGDYCDRPSQSLATELLDCPPPNPPSHKGTNQGMIACQICSSMPECDSKPLACPFYKLDPNKYFTCNGRKSMGINHVRQHITKDHCKHCWVAFNDEGPSKKHECQPMDGVPTNNLPPISKAQGIDPTMKWYWTWKQLFGEDIPSPQCPYYHPVQDLYNNASCTLYQKLETRGELMFTLDQIREVFSDLIEQITQS
ncbi:hypothetical protein F5B19DRAFT_469924 [Rostrohypoxylon terebratum]|nr:hypothetical protein F5B19DRAFT_469924 [Rostrohypoxylon terebratum]